MRRLLIWWLKRQRGKDGKFPRDLFNATPRIFGEACLELCIFRNDLKGNKEVYLSRRSIGDPFYSGAWHVPGTRKLPDDTDKIQLLRVLSEVPFFIDWRLVKYGYSITIHTERGTEYADVRYIIIPYCQDDPGFYDITELPSTTINSHRDFIEDLGEALNE